MSKLILKIYTYHCFFFFAKLLLPSFHNKRKKQNVLSSALLYYRVVTFFSLSLVFILLLLWLIWLWIGTKKTPESGMNRASVFGCLILTRKQQLCHGRKQSKLLVRVVGRFYLHEVTNGKYLSEYSHTELIWLE